MRRALWLAACVSIFSAGLLSVHRETVSNRGRRVDSIHRTLRNAGHSLRPALLATRFRARRQSVRIPAVRPLRSRVHLLARLIQAEAGDQAYPTQVAVGEVVLNRLRSPQFPHRLWAVINQPHQFSVVAAGTFAAARPAPRAIRAARAVFMGANPAPGTLYFYNPALPHVPWMNILVGCRNVGALRFCAGPR